MQPVVVQKYGGSSLADLDKIRAVSRRIIATRKRGYRVVAVVSAMGTTTDNLLEQAREISKAPKKRELDMLLSVGERISMTLISMAIEDQGLEAISFTGSQCGIITSDSHSNARIIDVRPVRIQDELERDRIVIVAGFQGMSYKREITTLGRGGSDTTAVALAAALGAKYCEICSDVDGVYSADPRIVSDTRKISELSYDEMETLGVAGASVLNPDAIEFARQRGLKVLLTSTFQDGAGTLLLEKSALPANGEIKAIATRKRLYRLSLFTETPEKTADLFRFLHLHRLPPECLRTDSERSGATEILLDPERAPDWSRLEKAFAESFPDGLRIEEDLAAVSAVGAGLSGRPDHLARAVEALKAAGISWLGLNLFRDRIDFLLHAEEASAATAALHGEFFSFPKDRGKNHVSCV